MNRAFYHVVYLRKTLMNLIMISGLGDLRTDRGVYLLLTKSSSSKVWSITEMRMKNSIEASN